MSMPEVVKPETLQAKRLTYPFQSSRDAVRSEWPAIGSGEFLLMCLSHNVKKITKEVLEGAVKLSDEHVRLAQMDTLGYRKERLSLVVVA